MLQMGRLICQERKQKQLTQEELAKGILSKSEMSRIENGQRIPDIFVLAALLQRLDISLEPFEIVVSNQEYELLQAGEYSVPICTTVVAEGVFFKDLRDAKGLSQEKFSSDICARETISKIENGRTPRQKKIQVLLEKQGEQFEKYYSYVVAKSFDVYELVRQYQEKAEKEPEQAKKILEEIRPQIDAKLPVNLQFLESSEIMEKRREGLLTAGEELAALERCLRYTMPEYDGDIYRIPYRQEIVILEEIVEDLKLLKREEKARELMQKIEEKCIKKLKIS